MILGTGKSELYRSKKAVSLMQVRVDVAVLRLKPTGQTSRLEADRVLPTSQS